MAIHLGQALAERRNQTIPFFVLPFKYYDYEEVCQLLQVTPLTDFTRTLDHGLREPADLVVIDNINAGAISILKRMGYLEEPIEVFELKKLKTMPMIKVNNDGEIYLSPVQTTISF